MRAGRERAELLSPDPGPRMGLEPEQWHDNPVIPHGWAATDPRWEQAEGERDFKARRLQQPRLKAHNAFWIKERDCFHLSSYKNNTRGKHRGRGAGSRKCSLLG